MRPLPQHTLQLNTCDIFQVGQPGVKVPAVDQRKREPDPRFPTYDVNVQHWDAGHRREEQLKYQLLTITSFLLWIWPLGFYLWCPKVKPNDSGRIKCCKQSRTAFFLIHWKCWKALAGGAVNHNAVKKKWKNGGWAGTVLVHCACPRTASWSWRVQPTILTESVTACEWTK